MYIIKKEKIIFDDSFNEIPSSILINEIKKFKKIKFGKNFNQIINFIPEGIESITLSLNFNQPIFTLPKTLRRLSLKNCINFKYTIHFLPLNIEIVKIPWYSFLDKLPKGKYTIIISSEFDLVKNNIIHYFDNIQSLYYKLKY